jgi:hypothetical protein
MLRCLPSSQEPDTRPAPTPSSRRHVFAVAGLVLFLLLLAYALGPIPLVYAIKHRGFDVPELIATVYQPTQWLYERTPLRKPMVRYQKFLDRL